MEFYNLLMFMTLVIATVWGAWKGLAWQIASFTSVVLSYFVAANLREPLARLMQDDPKLWHKGLAMLILYLFTSLFVWIAFRFVREMIDQARLQDFDRTTGGAMGFVKGCALCVLITMFSVALVGEESQDNIRNSWAGRRVTRFADTFEAFAPKEILNALHSIKDSELPGQLAEKARDALPAASIGGPNPRNDDGMADVDNRDRLWPGLGASNRNTGGQDTSGGWPANNNTAGDSRSADGSTDSRRPAYGTNDTRFGDNSRGGGLGTGGRQGGNFARNDDRNWTGGGTSPTGYTDPNGGNYQPQPREPVPPATPTWPNRFAGGLGQPNNGQAGLTQPNPPQLTQPNNPPNSRWPDLANPSPQTPRPGYGNGASPQVGFGGIPLRPEPGQPSGFQPTEPAQPQPPATNTAGTQPPTSNSLTLNAAESTDPTTPSDEAVLLALQQGDPPESAAARVVRTNVRIQKERIADESNPPKFYPMVGRAEFHHARFRCTVMSDKAVESGAGQGFNHTFRNLAEEVIIDHQYLRLAP